MAGIFKRPPHLLTLADLSVPQIYKILCHSARMKRQVPTQPYAIRKSEGRMLIPPPKLHPTLNSKSIALLFSKRSTRTRLAAETSINLLGGQSIFLGKDDIQLGVNESVRDTMRILSGMCQGIFARVGDHKDIEEMVHHADVPVINALSSLWHPTQVLADILTLHEQTDLQIDAPFNEDEMGLQDVLNRIRPLTIAYIGDSANVLHDMLVTYPRLGHHLRVASPAKYRAPPEVWNRVEELGCDKGIWWGEDPKEAVRDADVVVTDTWISMGQEHEKAERLADFEGYQVTESLCKEGGAKPNWKFLHCLPRKQDEVDDMVFYGPRSLVFPEADNRKFTILALFDLLFGRWMLPTKDVRRIPQNSHNSSHSSSNINRNTTPTTPSREREDPLMPKLTVPMSTEDLTDVFLRS